MKIILRSSLLLLVLFSSRFVETAHAQVTDTIVYDFNTNGSGSCNICGSFYDCFSTLNRTIVDNHSTSRLVGLKIMVFHTACGTGNYYGILNGDTIGNFIANYSCSCNSCAVDSIIVPQSKWSSYIIGDTNSLYLGNVTLCVDKILIIRSFAPTIPNNAAIHSIDSPFFQCPGSRNIVVTVANYGNNKLDSVNVNWSFNGVTQTPYLLRTAIDTIGSSNGNKKQITLGSKSILSTKADTLVVWTSLPNGGADSFPGDDTLRTYINSAKSGTFTVGGSSPDYSTLTAAISDLAQSGLCGPVTLNLRNGSYNEQISIPKINNASTTNTLTIQSESGDSSAVTINFSSSSSAQNFTLFLNNSASFILFKKITLEATGNSFAQVVVFSDDNKNIAFENCRIIGYATTSTSTNFACVFKPSANTSISNISFSDCRIQNGSYGILFNGFKTGQNHTFNSNIFEDQRYHNLYINNVKNLTIKYNTLSQSTSSAGYGSGITVYYSDSFNISHNRISLLNGGTGIYTYGNVGSSTSRSRIFNNFITSTSTNYNDVSAWYQEYSDYIDFFYNSTYVYSQSNSSSNLYHNNGTNIRIQNNSIYSDGNMQLIGISNSGSLNITKSDNNNFYQNGTERFQFNFSNIIGLNNWIATMKLDSNSRKGKPNYKSASDLHAYSSDLNAGGIVRSDVSVDIDNQTRNSSLPDIGADEFDLVPNDAGIAGIKSIRADSICVKANLKNFGNDTLKSATINWTLNGVSQTSYSWTGALASNGIDLVCLGYKKFKRDTIYTLKIWSNSPNGAADTINFNDTFQITFKPALSGVYTIGGTSPDFTSFGAAVAALNSAGILDSVKFKVRNGTYNENIEFGAISGATAQDAIIFESESLDSSKVVLSFSGTYSIPYVLKFNGARGITFRHLTIKNTSTTQPGRTIYFVGTNDQIRFKNNEIKNSIFNSTSTFYDPLVYSENINSNLQFTNNRMLGGSAALYLYSENNLLIEGNAFDSQYYYNIYFSYLAEVNIKNNTFNSRSNYNYFISVNLNNWNGKGSFNNNKIIGPNISEYAGLYINTASPYNSSDSFYIFNNFISVGGNDGAYSVYMNYVENLIFTNNNLLDYNTDTINSNALYLDYIDYTEITNNSIVNSHGGFPFYLSGYYSTVLTNYNSYFSPNGMIADFSGTKYSNLSSFQAIGRDSNSISTNPLYISAVDLHVNSLLLNAKGMARWFVVDDIDGETRNAMPDIGADEFEPLQRDIGITEFLSPGNAIVPGSTPIKVIIFNFGVDTVTNFKVGGIVNRDTFSLLTINDTLLPGDTLHVLLGSYTFKRDSINAIIAWTQNPNGGSDQKSANDTLRILNKKTSMSGVYTIGGTTPDFNTFNAAVEALKNNGISDSVRFRVRNGTYNEHIEITSIVGAGFANSIIFESENLDSSLVTLTYLPSANDSNYTIYLNGAKGITFRKLTLKSTGTSYSTVIKVENNASYNIFKNNNIEANSVTASSSNYSLISSRNSGTLENNNSFDGNRLQGGSIAFYWYGYGTYPNYYESGNRIENNYLINQYYIGIYINYQYGLIVSNNKIESSSAVSNFYGILSEYNLNGLQIVKNNIIRTGGGGYGIYSYSNNSNSSDTAIIANNMINITSNNSCYGLYLDYPYYYLIAHNTVQINSTNTYGAGIYIYYGNQNRVLNNIFSGGGSMSFNIQSASSVSNINFNNYLSSGSIFGNFNGTDYSSFAAYKSANPNDSNSLNINPVFKSISDLHISNIDLNGKAFKLNRILDDFDGELRDTIKPDIGADEFTPAPVDAGIADIITPKSPFASDTQMVKVVLRNFGTVSLSTVDVAWRLNGVMQTGVAVNKTIASGDTAHVILGKVFFHPDSAYSIICWSSLPNGINDTVNANDTAKSIDQYPALRGEYTIGGANPNFANFTQAVTALTRGGIIDSVIFKVRSGTYNEQIIIPLIVGTNRKQSIVFESENGDSSGVILTYPSHNYSDNYTLLLNKTKGIVFRKITISGGNSSYGTLVRILNGVTDVEISNCNLTGFSNTTSSNHYLISVVSNNTGNNNNVSIIGNTINSGSFGIYQDGYFNGKYDKQFRILNNAINSYYIGIYCNYADTAEITGNKITGSAYSYFSGVNLYNYRFVNLNKNSIINSNGNYGIYLDNCDGNSLKYSNVSNNMVYMGSNSSTSAVYLSSCDYVNYYYNNVNNTSTSTSSIAAQFYYGSNIKSINSIFKSNLGYALYTPTTSNIAVSDNNNYFMSGSNFVYWGSNYSNLSSLKSATSKDANSLNFNPLFVSNSDLHVRAVQLNGKGQKIVNIIDDFDGDTRDTTAPDIGADEFEIPSANDAGIIAYAAPLPAFASGNRTVKVLLFNHGSDTLKTATLNWQINGITQSSSSWSGNLATGASDTVVLGTYNFAAGIGYTLKSWPTVPNGTADTVNYNDTFVKNDLYAGLKGLYTVGGTLPDFNTLTAAINALKLGGVIDTVTFALRNGTYTEQVSIGSYPGSDVTRPVIITSETADSSKVTLSFNSSYSNNYIINLNNADNIKIRRLTFKPVNYYYANAVTFNGGTDNLEIANCMFSTTSTYYNSTAISSNGDQDLNTSILGNTIDGFNYGVLVYGNNSSTNTYENGLLINSNSFKNTQTYDVLLRYVKNFAITRNTLSTNASSIGISVYFSAENFTISHNKITGANRSRGIEINSHTGTSTLKGNIFNNFISQGQANAIAIYIYNSNFVNVDFNSVNLFGSSNTGHALYAHSNNNYNIRNNVLCNKGNGYAMLINGSLPSICDYNDLFTNGTNLVDHNSTNRATLAAWKSASSRDANSLSLDPIFLSNDDLHTSLINLDSAGTNVSGITDDIDGDTRNASKPDIGADEFNSLPHNVGIVSIDVNGGCDLDSQIIRLTVTNFGNISKSGFPIKYDINGSFIDSLIIADTLNPGISRQYSFVKKYRFSSYSNYIITAWTDLSSDQYRLNDTAKKGVYNYQSVATVGTMIPSDSTNNIDFPFSLSWTPATGATVYDVYIWPDSVSTRPSAATFTNITQISKQVTSGLGYGLMYKWQVVSKNPGCSIDGAIQRFRIKELPDIIVSNVSAPATAFSGNNISVSWVVKNIGSGTTGSITWYDYVYMSADQVWNGSDIYLGGNINAASLNPSQSYSNSATVTIPNGTSGKYYFIIRSDISNHLLESNEGNNLKSDSAGTTITLTPPPDLQVTAVTKPSVVFSGNDIPVAYTVKNKGAGGTRTTSWTDYIYLSPDSIFNGNAQYKRALNHSGALEPDSQYAVNTTIFIPLSISGRYFIYVRTDVGNSVYEHTQEGNNTTGSDSMIVKLTPPPDLVVGNFIFNDTVSNNEVVTFKYTISNIGGSPTTNAWYDYIYYSPSSTYASFNAVLLKGVTSSNVLNGDSIVKTVTFTMPKNIYGTLYLHVLGDFSNSVFEGVNENNNNGVQAFTIVSPNLIVPEVSNPAADSSGKNITLNWKVSNKGLGKDVNQSRRDLIYLGSSSTFKLDSALLIDSLTYTATIGVKDTISKSYVVKIPNGTAGIRYFYVHTDARLNIFENGLDGDNMGRGNAINIALSPSPDLTVLGISTQDTFTAGSYTQINYSIKNNGNKTASPQWKDRIYLSKDSVFDLSKCIVLGTKNVLNAIEVNQTKNDSQLLLIPGSVSAGNYYVYVYTEVENVIYEHNAEQNNVKRTAKVYTNGYPPVDLKIHDIIMPDSAFSGSTLTISWRVTNIGEATTLADFWHDRLYLSSDSILDASDLQIGNVQINKKLQADSTYSYSSNFTVPNGKNGMFYVLVKTDVNNENNDEDTSNNRASAINNLGAAKAIKIILTASPDLKIISWQVPSTAVAGQPIKIVWTVKNDGIGATTAGSWVDKIFLSTDYILDANDVSLGAKTHIGDLSISATYKDSTNYFLPSNSTGNFIIIIETDNTNRVYEHNAENNNTAASVVTIGAAPPADLVVTSVSAPSTVNSGGTISVNYTLKNIGSNPATGYARDNIYLSKDSFWDASDVLFKSNEIYSNLLPGISINRSVSNSVRGVAMGQYYVIVYTDIRNNINESNDTNNTAYSNTLDVNVPLLPLNTLTKDTLFANMELYYRLEIADSLDGESILVQLKGDSINGNNELFIRKNDVPSKSQFDFGYKDPFRGNQEIILPKVSVGTYYIMATGQSPGKSYQPVTLFARKLEFEIRKVSPTSGGNTGEVTLKIEGSKFEEGMKFSLSNDSLLINSEEPDSLGRMYSQSNLESKKAIIKDPTVAFVTFNLSDMPTGLLDVSAVKYLGETAVLKGGFTIANGIPPDIQLNVQRPSNSRSNVIIAFEVQYTNQGNINLNNGKLEIVSNGGAAISFTPGGLSQNLTKLSIIMEETDGPSGVLRPKGNGSTTIYTNSSTALGFNILMPE